MSQIFKIAVIQLYAKPLKIEENYKKAESFIRSAASQGAQLAVLPEYHLTSWVPEDPKFVELCEQSQAYLPKYQALAKECNISIVPGTIVERHPAEKEDDSVLLNIAYFIDNKGEILGKYIKKNLWHPERPHLTSSGSSPHEVFRTPFGPVGMLICWDLAFPEAFRELIAKGAKIIIIPSYWTLADCSAKGLKWNPRSEALFIDSTVVSRTFENTCALIYVNAGGPSEDGYAGLSQLAVPIKGSIGKHETPAEGMSIAELDMAILDAAEEMYKIRADIAREDWHYDYRKGSEKENSL